MHFDSAHMLLFKTSYIGCIVSYEHNKEFHDWVYGANPGFIKSKSSLHHTHISSKSCWYLASHLHYDITFTPGQINISPQNIQIWSPVSTPYANSVEIIMILPIWQCWRWIAISIECIIYSIIFSSSESNEIIPKNTELTHS